MSGNGSARGFDIQGHRGARGLLPENTLPGFQRALDLAVHTLELDVAVTRDGCVVVHHDLRLNHETTRLDGHWIDAADCPAVHHLTLAQLRRYDVGGIRPGSAYAARFPHQQPIPGTGVPTLDEVVALVHRHGDPRVRLNVEVKSDPGAPELTLAPEPFARAVIDALRRGGMAGRASVQSFDWRIMAHAQRLAPEIETAYLSTQGTHQDTIGGGRASPSPWTGEFQVDAHGGSVPRMVRAAGGRTWSPDHRDLDPDSLAIAHALGLRVVVWTVNEPDDIQRLVHMGVDGIISDYPDRVLAAVRDGGSSPQRHAGGLTPPAE